MTQSNFLTRSEAELRDIAQLAVEHAERIDGARARASVSIGGGVNASVRSGQIDKAQRDGNQNLSVTVFVEGRSGSASTAALDPASVKLAVEEAATIARNVQPDPDMDLADPAWLAFEGPKPDLFAPDRDGVQALLDSALHLEQAAFAALPDGYDITIVEAGAATSDTGWALAISGGFCRSMVSSSHARWCAAMARDADGQAIEFADSSGCRGDRLDSLDTLAARVAARAAARLGARTAPSMRGPVMFEARMAMEFLQDTIGALDGMAQWRGASFLPDAIGRRIAADHVQLVEDPFEDFALGSAPFDSEGVAGTRRALIEDGVSRGYLTSSLSARRLGLRSTGNADGPYNLELTSTREGGDLAAMRQRLGRGLVITAIKGGDTDPVTGTYTRAVGGYWVEDGVFAYPVDDLTVAGRLPDMLNNIVAIGSDVERNAVLRSGSILVDGIQVGGQA